MNTLSEELAELAILHANGHLTDAEYTAAKANAIARYKPQTTKIYSKLTTDEEKQEQKLRNYVARKYAMEKFSLVIICIVIGCCLILNILKMF